MSGDWRESRAFAAVDNYLYELRSGDSPQRVSKQSRATGARFAAGRPRAALPAAISTPQFSRASEYAAERWEVDMMDSWRASGRIKRDGRLLPRPGSVPPYTLVDVMRTMAHLGVFDRLAALADLNGVVEEGYLEKKEHQYIRTVMEDIADRRLLVSMSKEDTKTLFREIVRDEVTAIFGELKTAMREGIASNNVGGRRMRCKICREPGHRAPTCPKRADAAAAEPPAED